MSDELTVNTTDDNPGARPVKKKPAAKKPAAKKTAPKVKPVKKSGKPTGKKTAPALSKKAPSSGKPGKPKAAGGATKTEKPAAPAPKKTTAGSRPDKPGVNYAELKPVKMYGIARIDQPEKKNHGWYVRIGTGEAKTSTWFSDRKHGSKTKSLAAAQAHRDEEYAHLPNNLRLRGSKPFGKKKKG